MAVFDLSRPASCLGEHITSDHVYRDSDAMNEEARLVLVIKDVATAFMYAYPSALKDAEECQTALPHFIASTDQVGVFYIDDAKDLTKVSKTLGWRHEHSKDYVHQSNAIAERAVRATSEGTCFKLAFLMCMGLRPSNTHAPLSTFPIQRGLSILPGTKDSEKLSKASSCHSDLGLTIGLDPRPKGRIVRGLNQLLSQASASDIISARNEVEERDYRPFPQRAQQT